MKADAPNPPRIIGSVRRYVGRAHRWAVDLPVKIVEIHRGDADTGRVLRDDDEIGELLPGDLVEFAPRVEEPGRPPRWSWVTSDARPEELAEWPGWQGSRAPAPGAPA